LLHSNRRPGHWADWIEAAHGKRAFSASDMYCEDLSIIYECAIQGMGAALGQLRYLKHEFAQGKLVAPHPFVLRRPRGYHLVCPASQAEDAKIACFRQWLLAQV
jgi:LysR family glycine cleavage system transcriptional activator